MSEEQTTGGAAGRADEEGIRRTLALYCQLCDDGRFDEFADLFATEAVFEVMGRTYEGRDAIKGFMAKAQGPDARGKHVAMNSVIDVAGSSASAWTDYIFVGRTPGGEGAAGGGFAITSVGRYHDTLVREPDGVWRFASRAIVFLGEGDERNAPRYRS